METVKKIWNTIKSPKVIIPILMALLFLFSTTTYIGYDSNKKNQKLIKESEQRHIALEAREKAAYFVADSINKQSERRQKSLDSISAVNKIFNKEVSQSRIINISLAQKVKEARQKNDTAGFYLYTDSLVDKTEELSDRIVRDSTSNVIEKDLLVTQIIAKDILIRKKDSLYSALRADYTFEKQFNSQLVDENGQLKSQNKKLKRNKTGSTIVKAAMGAAIAGLIISK